MEDVNEGLTALASLGDPVRARLYAIVAESTEPVGRDEAATAAGITRALAAYHLDKLVEVGLLEASYQRPHGRGGPGAGRPPKLYRRSDREFAASVPPREYELAARLFLEALADAGVGACETLLDVARRYGIERGRERARTGADGGVQAASAAMEAILRDNGYEPVRAEDGTIHLRNCPFHELVDSDTGLVCGMNLALIEGVVAGLADGPADSSAGGSPDSPSGANAEAPELLPRLEPRAGQCCVAIETAGS